MVRKEGIYNAIPEGLLTCVAKCLPFKLQEKVAFK